VPLIVLIYIPIDTCFHYQLPYFVWGCQCAQAHSFNPTKYTLKLSIIDNKIDNNCL